MMVTLGVKWTRLFCCHACRPPKGQSAGMCSAPLSLESSLLTRVTSFYSRSQWRESMSYSEFAFARYAGFM
jgi:hypothetical protein